MFFTLLFSLIISVAHGAVVPVCDRSPSMVKFLEENLSLPCEKITEAELTQIKGSKFGDHLPISFLAFGPLKVGDFSGLTNVRGMTLSFHYTVIPHLPSDLFQGMTALEKVEIKASSDDRKSFISEGVFNGLPNLTEVEFAYFPLKNTPARLFIGAPSLKKVSFVENNMTAIHPEIFEGADSIEEVVLIGCCRQDHNAIAQLPEGLFHPLTRLKHLDLRQLGLKHLSSDVFDKNLQLQTLDLSRQVLERIPADLFKNQRDLEHLNMESVIAWPGLHAKNDFAQLRLDQFEKLKSLKISGPSTVGPVLEIGDVFFSSLPSSLEELSIWLFKIETEVESPFAHLRNLSVLEVMNSSGVESMGSHFLIGLENLKEFAWNRGLRSVSPKAFDSLVSIERISLGGNRIVSFPADPFSQNKKLYNVLLTGNPFFTSYVKDKLSRQYPNVSFY